MVREWKRNVNQEIIREVKKKNKEFCLDTKIDLQIEKLRFNLTEEWFAEGR
jgi:hypothetical protein